MESEMELQAYELAGDRISISEPEGREIRL